VWLGYCLLDAGAINDGHPAEGPHAQEPVGRRPEKPMNDRRSRTLAVPEVRRVVLLAPIGGVQRAIERELLELGFGVMCATSIEAALAFVGTAEVEAVVVQLSRFSTAALTKLTRGLLPHPDVFLVGGVSVVLAGHSSWTATIRWSGFRSPWQLSAGLTTGLN
jgi:hypothetical protein